MEWFGEWNGRPKWLRFKCPKSSSTSRCQVPIEPQTDGRGNSWKWDGNRERPTLSPSIHCTDCGYHFFITEGEQNPAPDHNRSEGGEERAREQALRCARSDVCAECFNPRAHETHEMIGGFPAPHAHYFKSPTG